MKIYTKTGDQGKTSLIGGCRVSKYDQRLEAYGTVDELNSHLGLAGDLLDGGDPGREELRTIQSRLFDLGSVLALDPAKKDRIKLRLILEGDIEQLEKWIDAYQGQLEPLSSFVLPGGHPLVSQIHIARTVARRAERLSWAIRDESAELQMARKYLNRLSDYLFILARAQAKRRGVKENLWTDR